MVNIIGAGMAGLAAAIALSERGVPCRLISSQCSERAQSVLAKGGINAALNVMGEHDSVEKHFADTMRGGVDLADPNAVWGLVSHAPDIVYWLASLGAPFARENGKFVQRCFGGQRVKRAAYAKSSTGKVLMTALIDEARKHEAAGIITRFPHHDAVAAVREAGRVTGVKIVDTYTKEMYLCPGPVILAMGGLNGLFPETTTGATQNTGTFTASLFAAGLEMADLEFIQYHPTTVPVPGKQLLVSEAARGEGGRLCIPRDGKRWYFMEELYPEMGNLMPRDVVAREIVRQGGAAYLDMTGIPGWKWESTLSDMREEIMERLGVDPARELVQVRPGIHFFMGGVWVNERHETSIPGLYAAGECACQYHGANRLGGNSLLGAIYGGGVAARSVLDGDIPAGEIKPLGPAALPAVSGLSAKKLRDILLGGLGILRSGEQIENALGLLDSWTASENLSESERDRALLGRAMLLSALARRESRGAHARTDFSEQDDEHFQKTTVCVCRGGAIDVSFRPIPERRSDYAHMP